jgi:hypothetical protein
MLPFEMSPKVNFGDMVSCLPDMSARHADVSPTLCDVGFFFPRVISLIADMSLGKYQMRM